MPGWRKLKPLNVIVGCEFSGVVREAFRKRGHNAWSCDLLPAADDSHYHIQGDVLKEIASLHGTGEPWDLAIFHPPCTHLSVSGAHLFKHKVKEQAEALEFVRKLLHAPIPKIALENPVGIISTKIRKPTQIIQPYQFGHDASKKTCLWLEGLPKLVTTQHVPGRFVCPEKHIWKHQGGLPVYCKECGKKWQREIWGNQTPSGQNKLGPSADRWAKRSFTYQGIADAMAATWG
jgi:site-specific DNA-cytosine methylase